MSKRVSLVNHEYNGLQWKAGEIVDVLPEHVQLLVLLGRIANEDAPAAKAEVSAPKIATPEATLEVETADAVADNNRAMTSQAGNVSTNKRSYNRKAVE